jgi:hypothetical protein
VGHSRHPPNPQTLRPRPRSLLFTIALASAAATLTAHGSEAQSPAPAPVLSLRARETAGVFERKLRLTGHLRGHAVSDAGQEVTLSADPYPFGDPVELDFDTTNSKGGFSFTDYPLVNTRYVARLTDQPTAASRRTTVFASPRLVFTTGQGIFNRHRAYFEIDVEAPCRYEDIDHVGQRVRMKRRRAYIYGLRRLGGKARRITSIRPRKPRCEGYLRASGRTTVRITRRLLSYRIIFPCVRGRIVAGMGRKRDRRSCGKRIYRG